MNFKIILFTCVFFIVSSFAANPTWTTPNKVGVSAFAVNDYSNYSPPANLYRTILFAI